MEIVEIEVKSMLIYNKRPPAWFGVKYYFNIYRGCMHGCIYCDTRSECYHIDDFDDKIEVKINAIELLRKELSRKRKKETVGFGSSSDPYIPIEKKYELTKQALELVYELRFPLFLLTKNSLVLRDVEIIQKISKQNYACVAFTITTADDDLAKKIEPNASPPSERFMAISILAALGINVGIVMMPILPFINDNVENITNIVNKAKQAGASFIYPSFGVTLRDRQRDYFYSKIPNRMQDQYTKRFGNYYSCYSPSYQKIKKAFIAECRKCGISYDMPTYDKDDLYHQLSFFNKDDY